MVGRMYPRPEISEAQERRILSAYRDGVTMEDLGRRYACGPDRIREILHRLGVQPRGLGRGQVGGNWGNQ